MMKKILLIFLVYLITSTFRMTTGEYLIKNHISSYLYKHFDNIEEEIFPSDIRINISFSRISGTLLYSIDKNMNQLIVSLSDDNDPTITVEFRKQEYLVSIIKLCGCDRCRYEILDLRIEIKYKIFLQCNGRGVQDIEYSSNKEVNEAFPLPYSLTALKKSLLNEAHLWIVNQEQYGEITPNPRQLLGCIFDVFYREKSINFSKISDHVGKKCIKACIGDICNGGQCYETYNEAPACDCTNTFLSGQYCNNTIAPINMRSLSQFFQFNMLKVSWMSSSTDILRLNNSEIEIKLHYISSSLLFEYRNTNGNDIIMKGTLSRKYVPNREYILLVNFSETTIDTKFLDNGSSLKVIIPTNRDLRKEIFTSLTLQSGDGYIDLYYKSYPRQYTWRKSHIKKFVEILEVQPTLKDNDDNVTVTIEKDSFNGYIIVLYVLLVVLVVSLVLVLIYLVKSRSKTKKYNYIYNKDESTLKRKREQILTTSLLSNQMNVIEKGGKQKDFEVPKGLFGMVNDKKPILRIRHFEECIPNLRGLRERKPF